jgi:hypothetical protein
MKIVKFEDGTYAVRKWDWGICFCYADNDNVDTWGWWPKIYTHNFKVDTLKEAEQILKDANH